MSRAYEPQELKKKFVKVPMLFGFTIFIQMISVNQDSKLKRTVKKRAISLIYRFMFSISQENFWAGTK